MAGTQGGGEGDVVFWDVRNTKVPMEVLDESHCDTVTSVKFHPSDYQKIISCGEDCLLNQFSFEGKKSMKEEETQEAVYSSE